MVGAILALFQDEVMRYIKEQAPEELEPFLTYEFRTLLNTTLRGPKNYKLAIFRTSKII